MLKNKYKSKSSQVLSIPAKSNRILSLIFFVLLLITLRLWQLTVLQHDQKLQEALKPKQKIFIKQSNRGEIYDRFGIPLAINQIRYDAGIFYAPIRQIPSISYSKNAKGKKVKSYPRKEYIAKLAQKMSTILNVDAKRIEDLIHAKASILFESPFVLKEGVTEQQYYQLKALEGSWPGIYAGLHSKRSYPMGKVAGSVIGYMGAINKQEFDALTEEKYLLEKFLYLWDLGAFPPLPNKMSSVSQARKRFKELKERCYSVYDWVGKTGIEASFNEQLRGFYGRSYFYSDAKGQYLKPLASAQQSLSGEKLKLTISAELQKYAEELLIENEKLRKSIHIDPTNGAVNYQKEPWIKGGAIAAIDPNNGEVLALASYPRYDPNDFILVGDELKKESGQKKVLKWLESEEYIKQLWDGQAQLSRETFNRKKNQVVEEEESLTWERYLNFILPSEHQVLNQMKKISSLSDAIELQFAFKKIMQLSQHANASHVLKTIYKNFSSSVSTTQLPTRIIAKIEKGFNENKEEFEFYKKTIDYYLASLENTYDRLLLLDLCQLCINDDLVDESIASDLSIISLATHREMERSYHTLEKNLKKMTLDLFRSHHFSKWRANHQKSFLKEKRKMEKEQKSYPKPYIDYLDEEEASQFKTFWQENKLQFFKVFLSGKMDLNADPALLVYLNHFLLWAAEIQKGAHSSLTWASDYQKLSTLYNQLPHNCAQKYLLTLRSYEDLNRPLFGKYHKVEGRKPLEKDLAKSFYPKHGYGFLRSYAFNQAIPQGSLFKLVTAYEALRQKYHQNPNASLEMLNPLTMVDDLHPSRKNQNKWNVGFWLSGEPIPQFYKGGRIPRSRRRGIGKINLMDALAVSSNTYFSILASDVLKNPEDVNLAAEQLSFGAKTGIDLPGEYAGVLPKDLSYNPTGLYSFAIGQHTLVVTPLQTALMFSAIANKGVIYKPQIVRSLEGVELAEHSKLFSQYHYDFKESLSCVGIDYPLFTCKERGEVSLKKQVDHKVKRVVEMPPKVQQYLLKSMRETIHGKLGNANPDRIRNYGSFHPCYKANQELKNQMVGKSSSAEIREVIDLDLKDGVGLYKHVWFGGIIYEDELNKDQWPSPELVVVVFLKYGDYGREAAPLVSAVAKKWREIKKAHQVQP